MLYDISPPITERLEVWPGDTPLSREVLSDMRSGAAITLSTIRATVHLGAHADAPSHYSPSGQAIGERPLEYYLGPCQVIRVPASRGTLITTRHLSEPIASPRVLLATDSFPDPSHFNDDFAALSPHLVDWLHEQGVRLIGVDTPSVDPFSSKDLPAHNACLGHGMAILEGLVLKDVPQGTYELIALPLRLMGFDASPVRAVLRSPG
jgi:arylformamidase